MPEESTDAGTSTDATGQTATTDQTQTTTSTTDADQLGEAGKRAIAAEREARQAAEKARKALEKELETLRAQSMSDAEKAVAQAKADGKAEALEAANGRLVRAAVKAAASGKLADPADATRFLDLDEFKVDDAGDVDEKAVDKAIDRLLKEKPYLASGAQRVQGSGDGGARGNGSQGVDMNSLLRRAAGRSA